MGLTVPSCVRPQKPSQPIATVEDEDPTAAVESKRARTAGGADQGMTKEMIEKEGPKPQSKKDGEAQEEGGQQKQHQQQKRVTGGEIRMVKRIMRYRPAPKTEDAQGEGEEEKKEGYDDWDSDPEYMEAVCKRLSEAPLPGFWRDPWALSDDEDDEDNEEPVAASSTSKNAETGTQVRQPTAFMNVFRSSLTTCLLPF
jgi:hypothetical protein